MARFIFAFVLSVVSASSVAATYNLGPSDYKKFGPSASHTAGGIRSTFGQGVNIGPGSLTVNRNPVIPYGSIGQGLRNFTRINPGSIAASAAITGIFLAVDWVFDQASGEWVRMGEPEIIDPEGFNNWASIGNAAGFYSSSADGVCRLASPVSSNGQCSFRTAEIASDGRNAQCKGVWGTNQNATCTLVTRVNTNCPAPSTYSTALGGCVLEGQYIPLSDADFNELASRLPTFPAPTVADAASDIQTKIGGPLPGFSDSDITGPSSVTGPSTTTTSTGPSGTETAVSTTTTNISYGPTTITTTTTTTTNNYTNGQPSGTTTTTETPSPDLVTEPSPSPGGSTSLDIPTDCEFMPTVCAFLDWFKEPVPMPEPDLPVVVDHDFEREYEMNLTAECPPPYTVDTQLFGTLSISWQPFCDLATLIKPLVVGSAFLLSAFITLGIGRGKS